MAKEKGGPSPSPATVRVRVREGAKIVTGRDANHTDIVAVGGDWIVLPVRELQIAAIRDWVQTAEDIEQGEQKAQETQVERSKTHDFFEGLKQSARAQAESAVESQKAVEAKQAKNILGSEDDSEE